MADSNAQGNSRRRIKVVRLIDEYDLDGIGDELEHRWTAEEDRMSLRDLAAYFNQQLLTAAMTAAGMQPLSGEIENVYRLLTADDVGDVDRTRAQRRLEREGVDVDKLDSDFVSYQAIRTYLKKERDAKHPTDDRPRTEIEVENLQRIRGRTASVTKGKLEQLINKDQISLADFRVLVEINVLCDNCGTQHDVVNLLEQRGCTCCRQTNLDE